jgi:predicted metal-dependent phosphoesterase TrpH
MPAYVERETIGPADAIAMIRDAGGLAVFAHPSFTKDYEAVAELLAGQGLFGMEVYYKAYEPELVASLRGLADRLGLFALGGSDFHGAGAADERLPGDIPLPDAVVTALLAAAREAGCRVPEPAGEGPS